MESHFEKIIQQWFLYEPIMLLTLLSHKIVENPKIEQIRSGRGMIEYNPKFLGNLAIEEFEERLKIELIRILLLHPYRYYEDKMIAYLASNLTLNEYYKLSDLKPQADDIWNDSYYYRRDFEFYVKEIKKVLEKFTVEVSQGNAESRENLNEAFGHSFGLSVEETELWEEDNYVSKRIIEIINSNAVDSHQWGSIPYYLQEHIITNLQPKFDYRIALRRFRASIISSQTKLSRFRPSRRYGWLFMGKENDFTSHLLIAIDVSGSISNEDLQNFYSIINRFFKYGIKQTSVFQFDTEVKGEPMLFKKAQKKISVLGRGGTNLQIPIDFFSKNHRAYDGLIIFTDGFALTPEVIAVHRKKILIVFNSYKNYEIKKRCFEPIAHVTWIE